MPTRKLDASEGSVSAWLVIALAIYLVRVMPWAMSELWYDEVITLGDYVFDIRGRGLGYVFRNYPVANNHILSSAVYWLWIRFIDFNVTAEHLVRAPSMALGALTIALVMGHWRVWLGKRLAILGGLLLAISPVFTAYAYQVRGYALTMALAAAAVSGAIEVINGRLWTGQVIVAATMLLLPIVIPSNVILAPVLALFIAIVLWQAGQSWTQCLLRILPALLASIVGFSYYFTLWEAFLAVSREPSGWPSAWMVAGNLTLALLAHAGLFAVTLVGAVVLCAGKRHARPPQPPFDPTLAPAGRDRDPVPVDAADSSNQHRQLPVPPGVAVGALTLGCVAVTAAVLLAARPGQAPYPRVFLVLLPPLTLAALLSGRVFAAIQRWPLMLAALLVVANGFVWERVSEAVTDAQLRRGATPNNLVQQYYRGADELRHLASLMAHQEWMENAIVVTDEYDFPTFRLYWQLAGGPYGTVIAINRIPDGFQVPRGGQNLWIVARNQEVAAGLYQRVTGGDADAIRQNFNRPGGLIEVAAYRRRGLFLPYMPKPPTIRKDLPPKTKNLV
ncbi:MAG: hypothetical protein BWX73_01226 [Lentisphaerae bacterium ADurb.Bin082]|nr:MAG: hypothetical protein BWX73_01226 [Lentisphaerae bacterium ADurb.Bin082]